MNINMNNNISNSISLNSYSSLKNVTSQNKSNDTSFIKPHNTDENIEYRGSSLPPELQLYHEKSSEFHDMFQSSYYDKVNGFKDNGLDTMYSKYQSTYEELQKSDLSEKDKEITLAALDDQLKHHSITFSRRLESQMIKVEAAIQFENKKAGIKTEKSQIKEWASNRRALRSSIQKLSQKLLDYFKNNISKTGTTLNYFLNENKSDNKDIDNMTFNQVGEFSNALSNIDFESKDKSYLDGYLGYFNDEPSDENIDIEKHREKLKSWLTGAEGFKSIVKKYNL